MSNATAPIAGADAAKTVMLCETKHSVVEAAAGHPAVLEPKFDGWRALFSVTEDGCKWVTRSGKSGTGKLPAIEAALAEKVKPGTTLDGEIVAFDVKDGMLVHRWGRVQEVLGSGTAKAALMSGDLTFVVFDVLAHAGIDARTVPFGKRREFLVQLFDAWDLPMNLVMLTPQVEATECNHDGIIANGYEGSVVKWTDAPYRSGVRGKGWFRLKPQTTIDTIVTGYKEGTPGSSFDGLVGAIEFAQYDKTTGLLVHRGRCSGFDWDLRKEISANRDAYLGRVMEIAHMGPFPPSPDYPAGSLRHPQFKRFRNDVEPLSVEVNDG